MKAWLVFGAVSGLAFGGWLSQVAQGLDTIDGLAIGLGTGLIAALGFASIPWNAMGRREW
ncbi:hypothetical protein sos41_25160 [Alphaproteobacteria bacterium SO-S41]|nr:hypothetical protein sos41_25160 [Alphaproteobacteria bacterium SO-S41]